MRCLTSLLCAPLLLLALPASAEERLAVLELSGDAVPADQRAALTDEIRGAVVERVSSEVKVMTRENMEVMLTDMGLDASCISEGACEVETARNLGVDYVVSGALTDFGGSLVISLKLHETGGGSLMASKRATGADGLALLDALGDTAHELVAGLDAGEGSPVVVEAVPAEVEATTVEDGAAAVEGDDEQPDPGYLPGAAAELFFKPLGFEALDSSRVEFGVLVGSSPVATVNALSQDRRAWKKKWRELAPCDQLDGDTRFAEVQREVAARQEGYIANLKVGLKDESRADLTKLLASPVLVQAIGGFGDAVDGVKEGTIATAHEACGK